MRTRYVGAVVLAVLWSMSTHGKPSAAGDEPHYLMVSQSLIEDGDLDLANNFAANEGARVGADNLQPGPHARVNRFGTLWSTHDIGLPVLSTPAFFIGTRTAAAISETTLAGFRMTRGRFAYSVVALFMIGLTVAAAMLFNLAMQRTATPWRAAIVTLVVVLSPPILVHGFLVFPEVPALLVTCAVIWLAFKPAAEIRFGAVFAIVLALGFTPWVHRKFSFFVLGLLFVLWRRHGDWFRAQSAGRKGAILAAFVLPQLALHVTTFLAWGNLGGPQMLDTLPFSAGGLWTGAAGLLADRSRGLLPYAPIYIVAPAIWWAGGRRYLDWLVPIALLYVPMAAFSTWNAGYSPAARFLVPLVPLVALPAAAALRDVRLRWLAAVPLLIQISITVSGWRHPRVLWPDDPAENRALAAVPLVGPALNRIAPVFDRGSWRD